jgi:hypothetical protein
MTKNLWLSLFALIISFLVHFAVGPFWGKLLADCLVAGVAAGIVWIWTPAASRALRRGAVEGSDKVILMIWSAWAMYLVQRCYALTSTAFGEPPWLTQGPVPQIIATVIFLAGMYGLTAPASPVGERHPPSVISGWFISGLVAGGTIVYAILTSGFTA